MYEWNYEVQKMIDYIEEHIQENPTLDSISQLFHYSKFYCSRQFHRIVGMTLSSIWQEDACIMQRFKFGIQKNQSSI